jgi:hypothetical protein
MKLHGITGQTLDIRGRQSVNFDFGGSKFNHKFLVFTLPRDTAGLLGTDFMEGTGAIINFDSGKMSLAKVAVTHRVRIESPTGKAALTDFTQGK